MDSALNAIQKTPVPTILILAGLLFVLLGLVTKIGGVIEVSPEYKRWTIPIGLLVLGIGLAIYFKPGPDVNALADSKPSAPSKISFRDWEGAWDLKYEYNGQWSGTTMTIRSDQTGIDGDYEVGRLRGTYPNGDFSKIAGDIENTTNTGIACESGKQTGSFTFNLAATRKSMTGWWDICGKGTRYTWKAEKRE